MSDEQEKQREREKAHRQAMANLMSQGLIKHPEAGQYYEKGDEKTDAEFELAKKRFPKYDIEEIRRLLPDVLEVEFDSREKTAKIHDGKGDPVLITFKKFPKDAEALAKAVREQYSLDIDRDAIAKAEDVFKDL